jgi:hypothetical protein
MSLRTDRPTHEMAATRPKDFGQALSTQPSVFWRTQRPRPRLPRRPASHHHRLAKRGTTTWLLRRLAADYRWQAEREALEALRSGHTREAFA